LAHGSSDHLIRATGYFSSRLKPTPASCRRIIQGRLLSIRDPKFPDGHERLVRHEHSPERTIQTDFLR
ncbi:hypothetical protein KBI52_01765, partial [Microvirga sp. HBU67558]|uniref:hypothetical protein n=1 Tax=Microvirga sp. HBU67558 TaxID=2824562 RepID=UPI001B3869D9